jgi:hypothetical protein
VDWNGSLVVPKPSIPLMLTTSTINIRYDSIGELASWNVTEGNGVARLNEQLAWAFDAAGNLRLRANGTLV